MTELEILKNRREEMLKTQKAHPWDSFRRKTFDRLEDKIFQLKQSQPSSPTEK